MAEQKLEEIKKEKLDDIYVDDKQLINKNKKKGKTKASKKNKPIDLFDYAKENGLDINLQYEETKPIEFPKDYNKKNENKRTYYPEKTNEKKDKDVKKTINDKKKEEKEKEHEKEDDKEKNYENNDYKKNNNYGNKGYYNKKEI